MTVEGGIKDPVALATQLKQTLGVVEHGLFVRMTDTVIVAGLDGPRAMGRSSI